MRHHITRDQTRHEQFILSQRPECGYVGLERKSRELTALGRACILPMSIGETVHWPLGRTRPEHFGFPAGQPEELDRLWDFDFEEVRNRARESFSVMERFIKTLS